MRFVPTYKLLEKFLSLIDVGSPTLPPHVETPQFERETYM